jgi:hypothetical protein
LPSVFVNYPPPKPEVILTNFCAEPTVLLVPIEQTSNTEASCKINNYFSELNQIATIGIKIL